MPATTTGNVYWPLVSDVTVRGSPVAGVSVTTAPDTGSSRPFARWCWTRPWIEPDGVVIGTLMDGVSPGGMVTGSESGE